jgi:hypothetical protein
MAAPIPLQSPVSDPRPFADDGILAGLHSYWDRHRRGRMVPDRKDIDPIAMGAALLPHVALVDVVDGGARFRNRLVGTAITERWGFEITGRHFDEVMGAGDYSDFIHGLYRDACTHRAPVYSESLFRWDVGTHMLTRRLYLPMTYGGDDIAIILVGQTFFGVARGSVKPYRAVFSDAVIERQRREIIAAAS